MRLIALTAMLCFSAPLLAQVDPQPVASDPRIQVVDYDPDRVVRLQAAQGYQITLQFGSDERIENVAVGDSAAWQVTANQRGDLLFVKPIREGVSTNLTVATDARLYAFELTPSFGSPADTGFMIRFRYPPPAEVADGGEQVMGSPQGGYRLSGARALRPSAISDDGTRTYIEWPEDRLLPAVFTIDPQGREALVNGNMRGRLYVIDSVLPQLLFRIDRDLARAVRVPLESAP